jgi:hypothetical protein
MNRSVKHSETGNATSPTNPAMKNGGLKKSNEPIPIAHTLTSPTRLRGATWRSRCSFSCIVCSCPTSRFSIQEVWRNILLRRICARPRRYAASVWLGSLLFMLSEGLLLRFLRQTGWSSSTEPRVGLHRTRTRTVSCYAPVRTELFHTIFRRKQ